MTITRTRVSICAWCGRSFSRPHQFGPIPQYCSHSHRQRAYEARRLPRIAMSLPPHLHPLRSVTCQHCSGTVYHATREDGQILALDPHPEPRIVLARREHSLGTGITSPGPLYAYDVASYRIHRCSGSF